jgi:hypothetical protein
VNKSTKFVNCGDYLFLGKNENFRQIKQQISKKEAKNKENVLINPKFCTQNAVRGTHHDRSFSYAQDACARRPERREPRARR